MTNFENLRFSKGGLIPTVTQNAESGEVLMVAWSSSDSLQRTIQSRQAWFWSRSRQALWHKGATSGNFLDIVEIRVDCDQDTLLFRVNPVGPACHTGQVSCFYRDLEEICSTNYSQ